MKIIFEVDFSDLKTMSEENVIDFICTKIYNNSLESLSECLDKHNPKAATPMEVAMVEIKWEEAELGRRLIRNMIVMK